MGYEALQQTGAIGTAVAWVQSALLGTIATSVAVIAVAAIGFSMLTGRVDVRRAAEVVIGCFIIFGASAIATGISSAVSGSSDQVAQSVRPAAPMYLPGPQTPYPAVPPATYDPYAGASVGPR